MFWSHNSIGVKIRRFSITNWIYKSVTCSPLSCFQYTYPDETFRNTEAYARVSTNAQLFARHGTCSYPRNNHCGNQETRWKPVDASAVFFFRGNFTRRWLPSEISVISVSSTLKGNEKIGEKMETTLLEVSRKILSIIGVTQRNDAYIRNRKNIHDYSFQSTTFRSRHSSSKNHHFPLHSNSQRRARTCLQVNRQHTRSSDNLPTKIRQLASIVRFRMPLDLDQPCTLRNRRTVDT